MSNPFTRGSLTTFPNGPAQSTDNLTALPNGEALGLGAVQLVTGGAPAADCVVAPIRIETGASGVSSAGYCLLFVICSENNTIWDGGVSPSSTSDQSALVGSIHQIQQVNTPATATQYSFDEFSIWARLGFVPTYFTVVVQNLSGATLNATAANFSAQYAVDTYN